MIDFSTNVFGGMFVFWMGRSRKQYETVLLWFSYAVSIQNEYGGLEVVK